MTDANAAIARFRAKLDAVKPPTGGLPATAIEAEVLPVLPLLAELSIDERVGEDFESFSFREALTVLTLFGRRLALLDLTPTAAVAVIEAALEAARNIDDPPTGAFDSHARVAALEGFVRGREERVDENASALARASVRPLRVDSEIFALVVSGVHEPEALSDFVDALGRAVLDADASIAVVDLSQLGEPNRDRARAIFAADEVLRMLGARCIFSGVDERWEAAATEAHVELSLLDVVRRFSDALDEARATRVDAEKERGTRWRTLLQRLRR